MNPAKFDPDRPNYTVCPIGRGGNRAGRAGLGRANSGSGQNRAGPKLARFFRAKIFTAQPVLKTGPVGPNSIFKEKKNSGGPGQIWPGFFQANNLMAQPGPNFGRTGLAHRAGPILPPLPIGPILKIEVFHPGANFLKLNCPIIHKNIQFH